jgi:hypothetical protein
MIPVQGGFLHVLSISHVFVPTASACSAFVSLLLE